MGMRLGQTYEFVLGNGKSIEVKLIKAGMNDWVFVESLRESDPHHRTCWINLKHVATIYMAP